MKATHKIYLSFLSGLADYQVPACVSVYQMCCSSRRYAVCLCVKEIEYILIHFSSFVHDFPGQVNPMQHVANCVVSISISFER